ncbi:MAG: hypothetical protein M3Y27_20700, partial [Acidobacteriota bacterium]|nr:hypothetical protein [Acidobacteriota bacterium]
ASVFSTSPFWVSRFHSLIQRHVSFYQRVAFHALPSTAVSRLNSLGLIRQAPTYARLAESGHLSRARLSQMMTLANLAPSIQETVLLLPCRMSGSEVVSEKQLRMIARQVDWAWQRKQFDAILSQQSR